MPSPKIVGLDCQACRHFLPLSQQKHALLSQILFPMKNLADALDALLPQTQCKRCGYEACRPYAEAMASGEALPNRCPPGEQTGANRLADVLGQSSSLLDAGRGRPGVNWTARIEPDFCIGCTKCIRACPVDAIIGANKRMHTIIAERCTGCELCLPPCPTDCIVLEPRASTSWGRADVATALKNYQARQLRLMHEPSARESSEDQASAGQHAVDHLVVDLPVQSPSHENGPGARENAVATATPPAARESALAKALAQARLRLSGRT